MATGPMGELKPGWVIDREWKVEDVYRIKGNNEKVWVLHHLKRGIQKYLNRKELYRLFSGERVR